MKSTQIYAGIFALSFLMAGALAQAASVTGTVTDKTTNRPAAGDPVVLVEPMSGMSEVGRTTTNGQGRYSLNLPGSNPYLIRVTHQGADYFIPAPQGGGSGDIPVYDVAAKVSGVSIAEHVTGVETDNGQLRVVERDEIHNASAPPTTQWSNRSFEVILPADAVLGDASAQRPGAGSLPTSVKLDADGPKGHYSFNFPIQPDEGGKGTLFQVQYQLPYSSGKYTFHSLVTLPADTVWIVLPKSMAFTGGSGSGFESSPQDPSVQTYLARNVAPGHEVEFSVSGTGSFARDDQNGQGNTGGQGDNGEQNAGLRGWAGRRHWRAHQYARSSVEVQVVDSWRVVAAAGGCSGLSAAQAGDCGGRGRDRYGCASRLSGIAVSSGLLHARIAYGQEHRGVEHAQRGAVCVGEREDRRHPHRGRIRRAKGGAGNDTQARAEEKLGFRFQGSGVRSSPARAIPFLPIAASRIPVSFNNEDPSSHAALSVLHCVAWR